MRQVDQAEVVWGLKFQLGRVSASLRRDLASRTPDVRRRAEQMLAEHLARSALSNFEILSAAPLPPGTDLYSRAAFGEGGTGAPAIDCIDRT